MPTTTERADAVHKQGRRTAQRLATREKLLQVSLDEFRRSGFAQADIAAIVERGGVARGTFYFHFPTKDDVLTELRVREERRIVSEVGALVAKRKPLDRTLRAVVAAIATAEDRLGVDLVREMCAAQFRPGVVQADTVSDHPVAELVVAAVEQACVDAAGGADAERAGDLAVIFLTGLFGVLSTHDGPSPERDRLIDVLIDLTLKGALTT